MSENKIVYCPNCGVQNDASHPYCYNCGAPLYESVKVSESVDGFCLAGMIVGIISIFLFSIIIPAAVGLVLSIVGYRRVYKGSRNRTFAIVGIVTSIVSLVIFFAILMIIFSLFTQISYYF